MFQKKKEPKNEMPKTKEKKHRIFGFMILIPVALILLGALLIFIPEVKPIHLVYVIDVIIMALGIVLIVQYFMRESFKNLQNYGFSFGAMFLLLGAAGLVKAETVSAFFLTILGAVLMLSAVLKLQNALDLKLLKDRFWFVFLLIAVLFAILALVVLLNPFGNQEGLEAFTQFVIFFDGIAGLIGTIYLSAILKKKEKQEMAEAEIADAAKTGPEKPADVEVIRPDEMEEEERAMRNPGIYEDFDAGIDD